MRARYFRLWPLLKETVLEWNRDNCLRLGASLSYYTLFSLFPLILVVLAIIRFLLTNSDAAREAILEGLASVTGGFRDEFVATLEAAIQSRRASGIIGTATLLLGASWVFGELVSAFNIIWDVEPPAAGGPWTFMRATLFSFSLVLAVAFLLLVSLIISAAVAALGTYTESLPGGGVVHAIVQTAINLVVLTLIFALLFKYLPQIRVAWGDVWIGAALTAVMWTILQFAISLYIALSSYENYGAVGSIMALVVWVYLSSQVVFLGGEFTAVFARQYGSQAQLLQNAPLAGQPEQATTAPDAQSATDDTGRHRPVAAGAVGVTIGVLGTLAAALISIIIGLGRIARRLRQR